MDKDDSTILEMVELNEYVISPFIIVRTIYKLGILLLKLKNYRKLKNKYPKMNEDFNKTIDKIFIDQRKIKNSLSVIKKNEEQQNLDKLKTEVKLLKSIVEIDIDLIFDLIKEMQKNMPHVIGPMEDLEKYKKSLIKIDNQCNKFLHK